MNPSTLKIKEILSDYVDETDLKRIENLKNIDDIIEFACNNLSKDSLLLFQTEIIPILPEAAI